MKTLKQSLHLLFLAIIVSTLIVSCSNKNEVEVKPSSLKVGGDLSDYLSVVDGSYKVTFIDRELRLMVKLKSIKALEENKRFEDIKAELLDETDMPLSGVGVFYIARGLWSAENDLSKINEALKTGAGEFVVELRYASIGKVNESEAIKIAVGKAKKFLVRASTEIVEEEVPSVNQNTSLSTSEFDNSYTSMSGSVSETGSEDWEQMLVDYDEYVTEYSKFYKKAMNGDNSALMAYPTMMEKATNLSESMSTAQKDNKLSADRVHYKPSHLGIRNLFLNCGLTPILLHLSIPLPS